MHRTSYPETHRKSCTFRTEVTYDELKYSLKIGRERLYIVNDIYEMYQDFRSGQTKKYGKELEFIHNPERKPC